MDRATVFPAGAPSPAHPRSSEWWTIVVVWNVVGIWDALSAYVVQSTTPWPSFFMIRTFGTSMFFAASALHLLCIVLVSRPSARRRFGLIG